MCDIIIDASFWTDRNVVGNHPQSIIHHFDIESRDNKTTDATDIIAALMTKDRDPTETVAMTSLRFNAIALMLDWAVFVYGKEKRFATNGKWNIYAGVPYSLDFLDRLQNPKVPGRKPLSKEGESIWTSRKKVPLRIRFSAKQENFPEDLNDAVNRVFGIAQDISTEFGLDFRQAGVMNDPYDYSGITEEEQAAIVQMDHAFLEMVHTLDPFLNLTMSQEQELNLTKHAEIHRRAFLAKKQRKTTLAPYPFNAQREYADS